MGVPYVTGPALVYAGLPTGIVGLLPLLVRPPDRIGAILTSSGLNVPVPPAVPTPGATIGSTPQALQDFLVVAFRRVVPVYLGSTEDTPQVDFDPAYVPVYRPEMGSTHPADRLYDGEEATIVCDLTSYNEFVYFFCAALGSAGVLNLFAPRGVAAEGHLGTLVVAEGMAIPLWLLFPYAQKPQMGLNGMPAGYRFFACTLTSHSLGNLNTKPRKVRLVWRGMRVGVPRTGVAGLYDHDVRGLPAAR